MNQALTVLELEMEQLRNDARAAHEDGDHATVRTACEQLRLAENAWYTRIGQVPQHAAQPRLQSKERMRLTLAVIGVPASPKEIRQVTRAFTGEDLPWAPLASVRRDEQRRYSTSARAANYICPALKADDFTPMRGLYALSEWPLERRLRAPTSARVDFLNMVTRLAAHDQSSSPPVQALLRRMADAIPGADVNKNASIATALARAAEAELRIITHDDLVRRAAAAHTARHQLDPVQQIFGAPRN
ncbi:hypothetical protein [Streptomyces sp. MMBL 11-1]|uniref:hypothetical protein n=1 Tax=Streptomyces sp. MMBL 11-1 TaxID=3026420 RepID=UPI002360175D|nr:hypothetical protein [Streptomyces sp. MMBL 11-1]